jgi:hydrogenase/urease accessory protein HupE
MRVRAARHAIGVAFCACAGPAAAHSPLPGIEGFYAGLLHPLSTPDQALALLSTGLLLGGFALRRLAVAFGAAAVGLAAGVATGLTPGSPTGDLAPWLFGFATLAAICAALAPGRALPLVALLSLGACALLGWAALPDAGPPRDRAFTVAGSVTGAALGLMYIAGCIDLLRERIRGPALCIALRVLAAWIAAITLLMLALLARKATEAVGAQPHI